MKNICKLLSILLTCTTLVIGLFTWCIHGQHKYRSGEVQLIERMNPELWHKDNTNKESMVLSFSYWEQTCNAMRNLLDLQCWARTVNILKVMEPAVFSVPGQVFHFSSQPNATFRDYFDLNFWNLISSHQNYSILVPFESFMKYSYRNIIFVQLLFRKHQACKTTEELSKSDWFRFLASNGFHIRSICIYVKDSIGDDFFQRYIFSTFNQSSQVSIFFNEWRGISPKLFRLKLQNSSCVATLSQLVTPNFKSREPKKITYPPSPRTPIVYSKQILKYCNEFLSEYLQGNKYVAVMLRSEKLDHSVVSNTKINKHSCIQKVLKDHQKALFQANTSRTLFFTDIGPHGSSAKKLKRKQSDVSIFSHLLEDSLDPYYSSEELNHRLELITKSNDSILIALVQSAIAARADAIVLIGGAAFQVQTLNIYAHNHIGHEKYFMRDSKCAREYISHFKW